MFICNPTPDTLSREIIDLYKDVCPSTLGHTTEFGFIRGLTALQQDFHFAGRALTVHLPAIDAIAIHKGMDVAQEGDVLVVSTSGDYDRACLGEIVAYAYARKKIAGAIIDGAVTDVRALRKMGIPIFCRGISPITTRSIGFEGAVNVPISVCNVVINPGDLVVADDDGIFVTGPDKARYYGELALQKQAKEPGFKERLDAGESLVSIIGTAKYFEK